MSYVGNQVEHKVYGSGKIVEEGNGLIWVEFPNNTKYAANRYCFHIPEDVDKGFILMPVSTVTDNWNDLTPDIILFTQDHDPLMIMEITTHKDLRRNFNKCLTLFARFPQAEYFVFDYNKNILYQYDAENNEWLTSIDYELASVYFDKPILDYIYL